MKVSDINAILISGGLGELAKSLG